MPTTFNVISLGEHTSIDTREGNSNSENAEALVGMTFGGAGDALSDHFQTLSDVSYSGGRNGYYSQDNSRSEDTFSIDGGTDQTFDGLAVYNATVSFSDGSSATISAVVFQDTDGNTYLAPEMSDNADQATLESGAIESITLDSVARDSRISGLAASRESWDYVTCFAAGTHILTPYGDVPVEHLKAGGQVVTRDHGVQTIRWVGSATRQGLGRLAPVCVTAGALGGGRPKRDLYVSQQHRLVVRGAVARRVLGADEVLLPAIKLTHLPGIYCAETSENVTYFHVLCDAHEILISEGAEAESLFLGEQAMDAMSDEARHEIFLLFPGSQWQKEQSRYHMPDSKSAEQLMQRVKRKRQCELQQ